MKKIFSVLLVNCVILSCLLLCSCKLELKKSEHITFVDTENSILDYVELDDGDSWRDVTAESEDPTIVSISGERIRAKKPGTTKIYFTYKKKKGVLTYKVYPILDYLTWRIENGASNCKIDYNACNWVLKNIDVFKNPQSVEVVKSFRHENSSGEIDYFMMEIRAQNGFGGYGTDFYQVTQSGIYKGFNPALYPTLDIPLYYDGYQLSYDMSYVNIALKERFNKF